MENASKALIIAGSVIVSILIIGLGVLLFNNSRDLVNSQSLTREQISSHNQQFEAYIGTDKTGDDVRTLLQTVRNSNLALSTDDYETQRITVVVNKGKEVDSPNELNSIINSIVKGKRYTVDVDYSTDTKLVNKVIVDENKRSS